MKKRIAICLVVILLLSNLMAFAQSGSLRVDYDYLNLRQKATTESKVLDQVHEGQTYKFTNKSGPWYAITVKGQSGWVHGDYITVTSQDKPQSTQKEEKMKVTTEVLNVRKGPSTSYDRLGYLEEGDVITATKESNNWYRFTYKGSKAYVSGEWLSPVASQPSQPSKPNKPTTPTTKTKYKVDTEVLNVRSGPSTDYKRLGQVTLNQEIEAYDHVKGWAVFTFKGQKAYCHAGYLKKISESKPTQKPQPNKPKPTVKKEVEVTADLLNVRSGPALTYRVIGGLTKGTKVTITSETPGWMGFTYKGSKAYISSDWVKVLKNKPTQPKPSEKPKPKPTPKPKKAMKVTTYLLNVRTGPSTDYKRIGSLKEGEVIEVTDEKNGWAIFTYKGQKAYCSMDYLKVVKTSQKPGEQKPQKPDQPKKRYFVQVTTPVLNVRKGPSTGHDRIGKVYQGDIIEIFTEKGNWVSFNYNHQKAWASFDYMMKLSGSKPYEAQQLNMRVIPGSRAKVYEYASSSSKVLGYLQSGQHVYVNGTFNDWACITFNGQKAWINLSFLLEAGTGSRVSQKTKVYAQANEKSSVIGSLNQGDSLTVLSEEGAFSAFNYEGRKAYVLTKHLQANQAPSMTSTYGFYVTNKKVALKNDASDKAGTLVSLAKGTPVVADGYKGSWYRIRTKTHQGYVHHSALSRVSNDKIRNTYAQVTLQRDAHCYWIPSSSYGKESTLKKGTKVTLTATSGAWSRILINNQSFWISSSALEAPKQTGRLIVTTNDLSLREKPAYGANLLGYVHKGQRFNYKDIDGEWYYIELSNGIRGWINGYYIEDITQNDTYDVSLSLASTRFVKDHPLLISLQTNAVDKVDLALYIDGKQVLNYGDHDYYVWKNPQKGKHTFEIRGKRAYDGLKQQKKEVVNLEAINTKNQYKETNQSYTLDEFAKIQMGRNVIWVNGEWTSDVTLEDIKKELDPDGILSMKNDLSVNKKPRQVRINDTGVNLWPKPNYNEKAIKALEYNEVCTLIGVHDSWLKVKSKDKVGFVNPSFVADVTTDSGPKSLGDQILTTQVTALKESPSASSKTLVTLGRFQTYPVLDTKANHKYMKVSAKGHEGYVLKDHITLSDGVSDNMYQFLDLSGTTGIEASQLDKLLTNKGILNQQGEAFKEAAQRYNINEIYLVSHALLETGNGKSVLATGVKVKDKVVYNMYGIGAYDSDPIKYGSEYAYNQGWTTPEKAIIGGAKFIANRYVHNEHGQNTLYKMKWNSQNVNYQYATDISWARKQTYHIAGLYRKTHGYQLRFDIPNYHY